MLSETVGRRPGNNLGVGEIVEPVSPHARGTTRAIATARWTAARPARLIEIVATPGSGNGHAMATAIQLRDALRDRGDEVTLDRAPRAAGPPAGVGELATYGSPVE
jgi:hypothetical protein